MGVTWENLHVDVVGGLDHKVGSYLPHQHLYFIVIFQFYVGTFSGKCTFAR